MKEFSVIMTVYDNARELEEHLPDFLAQDYDAGYEVIVVDESSTDDTDDVLKLQKQAHPQLYTTFLPKPQRNVTRRKLALTIGVKAAKRNWAILTDIHVAPNSDKWLTEIDAAISDTTALILGYYTKKGLRLKTYESLTDARKLIVKAERKRKDGHKGRHLRYLRGKYDFIVVPTAMAHDVLKYFECDVKALRLLGYRLGVVGHNLR